MGADIEKDHGSASLHSVAAEDLGDRAPVEVVPNSKYKRWAENIKGLETRGIEPVPLEERSDPSSTALLHIFLMWLSMGMAVNNIVIGSIGTLERDLSFTDAALCAVFGNLLGGLAVGYMSTWGPRSGNRTLV